MKEVRYDPCSIDGCTSTGALYDVRRALCKRHYVWFHDRDSLAPAPTLGDLLVLWRRTTEDGCWEWRGSISPEGYGRYGGVYIHRFSWERAHGPVPSGLDVDHLCRNRSCFNPDHLEPVTHEVNIQRGAKAHIIRTGECIHGHKMDHDNTLLHTTKKGQLRRICRTCQHLRYKKRIGQAA